MVSEYTSYGNFSFVINVTNVFTSLKWGYLGVGIQRSRWLCKASMNFVRGGAVVVGDVDGG